MFGVKASLPGATLSGSASLPFPTCPGEFWAQALTTIYGPGHVLLGICPSPKITDDQGNPLETGPILAGLIFQIGVGTSTQGPNPTVQVKLNLMDLKMVNLNGAVYIEYDVNKPGEDCTLLTLDAKKIFEKFAEFLNPLNWPSLTEEFTKDPIAFYKRNIEIFYPAGVNITLNVKAAVGGALAALGQKNLVNLSTIRVSCSSTPEFPPKNVGFSPDSPVSLVRYDTLETVARIEDIPVIYAHVFVDERVCQAVTAATLTIDYLKEYVGKFFNVPNWP